MFEIIKVFIGPLISIIEKTAPSFHDRLAGQPVKYGDTIRLKHVNTNHVLHSHRIINTHPYSSGQQQVTAYSGHDSNDYWLIKGQHGLSPDKKDRQVVRDGDVIRLEHVPTKRNLHSHSNIPSPLAGQQEVTAFGENGEGDVNDNWQVEVNGKGIWYEKKRIRLIHLETHHALHSHAGHSHGQFTEGQQEVTCFYGRDHNDFWVKCS